MTVDRRWIETLGRVCGRREFLRACGALGLGVVAGGVLQARYRILPVPDETGTVTRSRTAMGTFLTITAAHASRETADEAIERAFEEVERLVGLLSRHDRAAALAVLNDQGRLDAPPPELLEVLSRADSVHRTSDGAFDPTVAPLVDLYARSVGAEGRVPADAEVRDALDRVGFAHVSYDGRRVRFDRRGVGLTLDGIAKGYVADRASEVMTRHGVPDHLVDAGGDIRASGSRGGRPWRVAVQDPAGRGRYPAVVALDGGAVATSGDYEVFYDEHRLYHHIVDPRSGRSPQACTQVTVRAPSVMEADALSTAVFVLGPEAGTALVDRIEHAETLIVTRDGATRRSRGWRA